jgi:hypothetical protein
MNDVKKGINDEGNATRQLPDKLKDVSFNVNPNKPGQIGIILIPFACKPESGL